MVFSARPAAGYRMVLIEATSFTPARLAMAPVGVRLPAGVRAVAGVAVPVVATVDRASASASASGLFAATAFDSGPGLFAATASASGPELFAATASTRGSAAAAPRAMLHVGGAGGRSTPFGAASARSRFLSARSGRRGYSGVVVAALGEPGRSVDRATEEVVLFYDHERSASHVAAWIEIARLRTTFEVAFDAGVLESGRDLRMTLDVIGEVDLMARIYPWTVDSCLQRVCGVIGNDRLEMLRSPQTPETDDQFYWSSIVAETVIAAISRLAAHLHALIILNEGWMRPLPRSALYDSYPSFVHKLTDSVREFSTIVESTKFKKPQNSIRFRMLEAHALGLEHLFAVAFDLIGEVCPAGHQLQWKDIRKDLTNRRITLFEQDMGLEDYMYSIGLNDTKDVIKFVDSVSWAIKNVLLGVVSS